MKWLANQLMQASHRAGLGLDVTRYNPRPAGVFRAGSATEAVLAFLLERFEDFPKQFWSTYQIRVATGHTPAAISAALGYLLTQAVVEATADGGRNPRYRRYRATAATELAGKARRATE